MIHTPQPAPSTTALALASTRVAGDPRVRVAVLWDDELLEVLDRPANSPFRIGPGPGDDFVVPETLAAASHRLVELGEDGSACVRAPAGAKVRVRDALGAATHAGERVPLDPHRPVEVRCGRLTFRISAGPAESAPPRERVGRDARRLLGFLALSAAAHGALMAALFASAPPLGLLDDEAAQRDRLYLLRQYLEAAAERERAPEPEAEASSEHGGGEAAERARGAEGRAGQPEAANVPRRLAIEGDANATRPSRAEQIEAARSFGMIGMLTELAASGLTAPWDAAPAGSDPVTAAGGLWGDDIGESWGTGGLALSSTGIGGGGRAEAIAVGEVGVCPSGFCTGLDRGIGRGPAKGRGPGHAAAAPRLRLASDPTVSGRVPSEVIQRIVRQAYGRFRGCYEDGLRRNPNLTGRVSVRFVIARDGSVASALPGASDLPDPTVVSCVVRAYHALSFPSPGDGIVSVTYPILFTPSA